MYDLTLIEFSKEKARPKQTHNPAFSSRYFGFLQAAPLEEISQSKDVTSLFGEGRYDFETPYFIFYLYDLFDEASAGFIADCGGRLNNLSSSNVTILTFFEKGMVDSWRNVQQRGKIRCREKIDSYKVTQALEILKKRFSVSSLPCLIVVKKDDQGDKSLVIPLGEKEPSSIYNSFETVIKIINDNCEEDFSFLSKKLLGEDAPSIGDDLFGEATNDAYLFNFIDEAREKEKLTMAYLYTALGVSRKTFYNKRNNATFSREQCLKLGILLGFDDSSLNRLLRFNRQSDLTFSEQDRKVRQAISEGRRFEDVEDDIFE